MIFTVTLKGWRSESLSKSQSHLVKYVVAEKRQDIIDLMNTFDTGLIIHEVRPYFHDKSPKQIDLDIIMGNSFLPIRRELEEWTEQSMLAMTVAIFNQIR